jgi:hypothetical protein
MARFPETLPLGLFKICFRLISAFGNAFCRRRQVPFLQRLL